MRAIVCILMLWASTALAQDKTIGTTQLPAGTEKRAAVIFANQDYTESRYDLQKTHNDADDMAKVLGSMGFKVIVFKKDLNERNFSREVQALRDQLRGYQVVFFYYSGHGAEYRGENYLIPTDVSLEFNADIEAQGIKLSTVYEVLQDAGVKTSIVALDACRSLPVGKGNLSNGLVIPATNPAGTFTMYATRAGKIAKENLNGRNSYFTQELKKYLPQPNLTLNDIHYKTRQGVKVATQNGQEPGVANELDGEFTFLLKELPSTVDPEKEALRAEIERLKAEQKNTIPADNTRVSTPTRTKDLPPFMTMVSIQGGTFKRGDYEITVNSFSMGKYEVTVGQYLQFCKETNGHWPEWKEKGSDYNIESGNDYHYKKMGKALTNPEYPIVGVSWHDAVAFCDWLSKKDGKVYRLPTEAEWEYAAGGGSGERSIWSGTSNEGAVNQYGNIIQKTDGYEYTSPVGVFPPNSLSLHDLIGNVWEWCNDWYGDYLKQSVVNPKGPVNGIYRVLRGGSWFLPPNHARVAYRYSNSPGIRSAYYGFRVVSPISPAVRDERNE
ncbi:SUMF1/EgtB/PvdO family nonheme iron enzyme [Runella salmonicolor]|uniref:SUMF1/EgtB/PvdO family nonheme iron enzyme n=1 Tax=Runella salmonicolor TaxID=2950278 RepID=A0ABT1FXQ6_9BACT|nr:SUMF1/EgtB/PvdO family nonheme iron enzyme [Runella salmonicolor]MCP1386255.1 SUMF1/EgtB/PvdO family nonheme iron enzyme [Runella salmonicolor]